MKFNLKKILMWILIIFVIYAIFTSPRESADVVSSIWNIIANGFRAVGVFFDSIINS